MKRDKILNMIIEEQQKVIASLKETVKRYKTASDIDEDDTLDPEDLSNQSQAKDMQLRYEKMLRDAQAESKFLEDELQTNHTEIENGCLIETDKNWLFVGISVPMFQYDDKEVLSFSDDAPVFKNLVNKKAGDQVEIGSNSYLIKNIF